MPIVWRLLLKNYIKVFTLALLSFLTLLIVSRLEEIAQFAALGTSWFTVGKFAFFQIPYILPITLPISCLISSVLLFQKLSHTQELTALRSSGLSLRTVIAPLLLASLLLSALNFYVTSELSTTSHLATRKMAYELTSVNPLILLQNSKIAKLQGAYVQMEPLKNGESAEELVVALPHHTTNRLQLLIAKKLEIKDQTLKGTSVSFISSLPSALPNDFDHLMIENQALSEAQAPEFARLLRNQGWKIANDHLTFRLLKIKMEGVKKHLAADPSKKDIQKLLNKCYSEVVRRIAFTLAPFTFTFMGAAFGMEISRRRTKKGLISVICLSAFTLICFFIGKELDPYFIPSSLLFLLPHLLILVLAFKTVLKVQRGIE